MIEGLEIRNFKSIKSKYFPLRNLNVLMGLNGQGKSSFIQSLLLLRQSSDTIEKGVLKLNGKYANIGSAKDALYQYAASGEKFGLSISFQKNQKFNLNFGYKPDTDVIEDISMRSQNSFALDLKEALFSEHFQYLSAFRGKPKSSHERGYSEVESFNSVGNDGEFTVDFLERRGDENLVFDSMIHPKTPKSKNNMGETVLDRSLSNQVNLWLQEVSPKVHIKTTSISSNLVQLEYEFEQDTYGKTNTFKPENVGYGISAALPVIVCILKARKGDLLIIENPESQLHPKGQALIGRLLAILALNEVQIVVETHSDHVINGIRVGIKEEPDLRDRAILFYFEKLFEPEEQFSKITNIEFDRNGELSDYPKHLLDEWSNQLLKLL